MNTASPLSDAIPVSDEQRMSFLPMLFGRDLLRAEASIFSYAQRYCPAYSGGLWNFYMLPDGGGFMAPDLETLVFRNADNWFEQEVTGEVAGIILTALVLNHRSWHHSHHDNEEMCAHFCLRYEQLMAFADSHPDSAAIWRALD